jgi:hypothetical protein
LSRLFHRQGADAHRVEQLKDGGVGADAERQRQDRHDRERRVHPEQPCAVLEVAPRAVEKADGVHLQVSSQTGVGFRSVRRAAWRAGPTGTEGNVWR